MSSPFLPSPNVPAPDALLQAEQLVIAALWSMHPDQIEIDPEHCIYPVHAAILRIALLQVAEGMPVTAAGLAASLGSALDDVGGEAYLIELAMMQPSLDAVAESASKVRDAWQRRCLIDIGERLQLLGVEAVQDAFDFTSRATASVQTQGVLDRLLLAIADVIRVAAPVPSDPLADMHRARAVLLRGMVGK